MHELAHAGKRKQDLGWNYHIERVPQVCTHLLMSRLKGLSVVCIRFDDLLQTHSGKHKETLVAAVHVRSLCLGHPRTRKAKISIK